MASNSLAAVGVATAGPIEYYPGDIVPFRFNPGIAVASYFISLTGSITTVELLHRREASKGLTNLFELGSSSVSMGLVGIWAMHYVGNRSIVLGGGSPSLQLLYNPGFTALSSFIPIVTLFFAFLLADRRYKGSNYYVPSILLSGLVAGLAICGMHYTASLGVSNYDVIFDSAYIGGAIAIACFSCMVALALIFVLQEMWLNVLPWRIVCACLLAGAVSSMHWEASCGTSYRLKRRLPGDSASRNTNFVIAIVLSLATIPVCAIITVASARHRKQVLERAQQTILACARFDPDGKLLVTQEGHLPCSKIIYDHNKPDQLDVANPAFHWIFRASHNWSAVSRYIPMMAHHLSAAKFMTSHVRNADRPAATVASDVRMYTTNVNNSSVTFRESFCVAAGDLATDLAVELCDVGSLYDEIMVTGTVQYLPASGEARRSSDHVRTASRPKVDDVEASPGLELIGNGQLMVLMHQCDGKEATKLVSGGYRFVTLDKVVDMLSRSMQMPQTYLTHHLLRLRDCASEERECPTGTLLGCFALRANVAKRDWDVLVAKKYSERLPQVQLTSNNLDEVALALLKRLDGRSVTICLQLLDETADRHGDAVSLQFAILLRRQISKLADIISEPFFQDAIFSSDILHIPTFDHVQTGTSFSNLLVFHIIPDIHGASLQHSQTLMYTPLSFFQCRQQVVQGAPHHSSFARKVHHEFAAMLPPYMESSTQLSRSSAASPALPYEGGSVYAKPVRSPLGSIYSSSSMQKSSSQSQEHEIQDLIHRSARTVPHGGIMVSQAITVEPSPAEQKVEDVEYVRSGTRAYAETADAELPTFVSELFERTVKTWRSRESTKGKESVEYRVAGW